MAIETRPPHESDLETIDINVNVGPQHPATHGVFRMVLTVDGELVKDLDPVIGYMHRGNEKLPENCDYRQVIAIPDRTDTWRSSTRSTASSRRWRSSARCPYPSAHSISA